MKLVVTTLVGVLLAVAVAIGASADRARSPHPAASSPDARHHDEGRTGGAAAALPEATMQAVVPASSATGGVWRDVNLRAAVSAAQPIAATGTIRPATCSRPHDPPHLHACPLLI